MPVYMYFFINTKNSKAYRKNNIHPCYSVYFETYIDDKHNGQKNTT